MVDKSTTVNRLIIPAQRSVTDEKLFSAIPWFLRDKDAKPILRDENGKLVNAPPELLQFTRDEFIDALFQAIELSPESFNAEAFEKLISYRDYAEPPNSMRNLQGEPLYPTTGPEAILRYEPRTELLEDQVTPQQAEQSEQATIAWLRKLYLPLQRHFHIVSTEIVCARDGYPRLVRKRILEAGLIVRRLVADQAHQRWEDWVRVTEDKGLWLEIADRNMAPLGLGPQHPTIDPHSIDEAVPAAAEAELRARLNLSLEDELPNTLQTEPLSLLSSTIGTAAEHTVLYGYAPVMSRAHQLPQKTKNPGDIRQILKDRARKHLRKELFSDDPENSLSNAELVANVNSLRESIRAPLRQLLELILLPTKPNTVAVESARSALETSVIGFGPPSKDADVDATKTLLAAMWDRADNFNDKDNWWNSVINAGIEDAKKGTLTGAWNAEAFNKVTSGPTDLAILMKNHIYVIVDRFAPALSDVQSPTANNDTEVKQVIAILLMRIRAVRKQLGKVIYANTLGYFDIDFDLNRILPPRNDPVVTAGSLADELSAWLALNTTQGRVEWPQPWPASTPARFLVDAHALATELEAVFHDVHTRGSGAGNAYTEVISARIATVDMDLSAQLAIGTSNLRRQGLDLNGQPEFGLLVHPGPAPTLDTMNNFIDAVITRYDSGQSDDEVNRETANLLNLVRPRFDADSLYAIWCYARVAGRTPCEEERILWTQRSDVFAIAEPSDILGVRPVPCNCPT